MFRFDKAVTGYRTPWLVVTAEVDEVRFVLLHNFGRRDFLRTLPDKIHLVMNRAQRKSSFEDQKDAAVKEKTRAEYPQNNRDQVVTLIVCEADNTNRNTRSHKHSQAEIKHDHASLEQPSATGQLVELFEYDFLPLRDVRLLTGTVRHRFKSI